LAHRDFAELVGAIGSRHLIETAQRKISSEFHLCNTPELSNDTHRSLRSDPGARHYADAFGACDLTTLLDGLPAVADLGYVGSRGY
jgi:hypothetical protein